MINAISVIDSQPCKSLKNPKMRRLYGQNLAIFVPVCLHFYLRFSALFLCSFASGTRLACNPLTNRLHRVRLYRVRQIAYM